MSMPPYLLQEVIYEIVLRLSVKGVIRFSSVSKLWKGIIHDKDFIKEHHQRRSIKKSKNAADKYLIRHYQVDDNDQFYLVALSDTCRLNKEERMKHRPLYSSLEERGRLGESFESSILALCNGLILLEVRRNNKRRDWFFDDDDDDDEDDDDDADDEGKSRRKLFLWNPMISKHRRIPLPYDDEDRPGVGRTQMYGLGYHSHEDDFKVSTLVQDEDDLTTSTELRIYSLASNTWKTMKKLPYNNLVVSPKCQSADMVWLNNSCVAWLMMRRDDRISYSVVTFDLVTEDYHAFPIPVEVDARQVETNFRVKIKLLGGFLSFCCLVTEDLRVTKTRVWSMKEDSSWSMFYSTDYFWESLFSDGDWILINRWNAVEWFNMETNDVESLFRPTQNPGKHKFTQTSVCVGNLCLLLNGDNDGHPVAAVRYPVPKEIPLFM